jgi:hypothetical protein
LSYFAVLPIHLLGNRSITVKAILQMKLEHYINIQQDINKALQSGNASGSDAALFNALFSEQIELQREHVEADEMFVADDMLAGIVKNSRPSTHNKVLASDYECASALNSAFQGNRILDVRFLLCSQSSPLSMHDDSRYIDDTVMANCPYDAQQRIEKQRKTDVFATIDEPTNVEIEQQTTMLDDVIAMAQSQLL